MKFTTLAFLISAFSIFTSCAPKDEKLNRPGSSNLQTQSVDDTLKLSFITFDKQAEALHNLKVLINPEYAEKKGYVVTTVSETETQFVKRITGELNIQDEKSAQTSTANILALVTLKDGYIVSVLLVDDSLKQSDSHSFPIDDKGLKAAKPNLSVGHAKKSVRITRTENGDVYELSLNSVDEVISNAKNGETFVDMSRVSVTTLFAWDGQDKLNGPIQLRSTALAHTKMNQNKSEIALVSETSELTLELKSECVSYSGGMVLIYAKLAKGTTAESFKFSFNDSSIEVIGKKAAAKAAACAARPIVDLNKLR